MANQTSSNESLETEFRKRFKAIFDVDEPDGSCIAPLIAGVGKCPHGWPTAEPYQQTPPHQPPRGAHGELWLRDGEPGAYSTHVSDLEREVLAAYLDFTDLHGLEIRFTAASWINPQRAIYVVFYPPEWRPE